jgi:hypothetical protein
MSPVTGMFVTSRSGLMFAETANWLQQAARFGAQENWQEIVD